MPGPGDAEEAPAASDGRRLRVVPEPGSRTAPGTGETVRIAPGGWPRTSPAGAGLPRRAS
ncbi:hypothetical protein ACWEO4_34845 [Streptomyces sp. NPDC004393]|uniref:hypothetical protein n=1 Tax=Streptomyces sp. NPDC004533 TaxID=3154278 RepID=UPI0033BA3032